MAAAANTAALIETVCAAPGKRVLNSADPDTPTAEQIVRTIGERLGWNRRLELLDAAADPAVGEHPWRATHPIVLDTSVAERLGYVPQGDALDLLTQEIDCPGGCQLLARRGRGAGLHVERNDDPASVGSSEESLGRHMRGLPALNLTPGWLAPWWASRGGLASERVSRTSHLLTS